MNNIQHQQYGRYVVRSDGQVFSMYHGWGLRKLPKQLKPRLVGKKPNQYVQYRLYQEDSEEYIKGHALVMKLFGPPKPADGYNIDHIDGDTGNNDISNLQWLTNKENCIKSQGIPISLMNKHGCQHHFRCMTEAAEFIKAPVGNLSKLRKGQRKSVMGYTLCPTS